MGSNYAERPERVEPPRRSQDQKQHLHRHRAI